MVRHLTKPKDSEVDAYSYIKEQLSLLGWVVKNPARNLNGEVYRQNECLNHPEIKKCFGLDKPEAVVKLSTSEFWIVESKRSQKQLDQALSEAEGYANKINTNNKVIKALIVSGVAGNDTDTYLVKHRYWNGQTFIPITINEQEPTGLLSKELVEDILRNKSPTIQDIPPISESFFIKKAETINEILHNGAINLNYRARAIAALALCYLAKEMPNRENDANELIKEINIRVEEVLEKQGKGEFKSLIQLQLPTSRDNHKKFRNAIIQTFQELDNLNIRSAMRSNTDVLGKFYEVFLKYGNGAKEIGIVLTPRHITKFAAEVMGITHKDIVYDPTCGTGGFLVAAFDFVKHNSTKDQTDLFKQYGLFGIDQEESVIALAIVNMIFRGDGKNNMHEGNCFNHHIIPTTVKDDKYGDILTAKYSPNPSQKKTVTKVLMNPPFALKVEDEQEYKFVKYALEEVEDGGILFSILPISTMVESTAYEWRKSLVTDNTLLAVISFSDELFYPISQNTVGLFVRKGRSTVQNNSTPNVLWCRAVYDGFLKKKGKRLFFNDTRDDLTQITPYVQQFIANQNISLTTIPQILKICPPNITGGELELAPEAYLDDKTYNESDILEEMNKLFRENQAFKVRYGEQYADDQ